MSTCIARRRLYVVVDNAKLASLFHSLMERYECRQAFRC